TMMRPSSVCSTISCSFGTSRIGSIRNFPPSISKMNAGTDTPFRHSLISGRRPAGRLPVAVEAFARLGDPAGNCVELASRGEHFHQHLQGVLRFGPARIEDELHADLDQLLRRDAEVQSTLQMLHELPFHPLRRECGAGHHAAFPAGDDPSRPAESEHRLVGELGPVTGYDVDCRSSDCWRIFAKEVFLYLLTKCSS